jgi:hypothetical protein
MTQSMGQLTIVLVLVDIAAGRWACADAVVGRHAGGPEVAARVDSAAAAVAAGAQERDVRRASEAAAAVRAAHPVGDNVPVATQDFRVIEINATIFHGADARALRVTDM